MLEYIATIKFLALFGYAVLLVVCVRGTVSPGLKLHFALYLLGLGAWQLTSFVLTTTRHPEAALFWYNMQVTCLVLQSVIFLPLTRTFLQSRGRRWIAHLSYVVCGLLMIVGFLRVSFSGVEPGQAGYYVPILAPAAYAVSLVGYAFWLWGLISLVVGLRRERLPLQRSRIRYVLAGALTVMVGIGTNYTPLRAWPVDTLCALVNAILVSFAVTRYRLIDTGAVLRRVLAVTVVVAVAAGGYILFSSLAGLIVRPGAGLQLSVPGLAGFIVLLVLSLMTGLRVIGPVVDRIAGRRTISYDRILEAFTRSTRSLLDLDMLKALVVKTAADAVGTERGCLLFAGPDGANYTAGSYFGTWHGEMEAFSLRGSDDFVRALKERKFPLWEQELLINPGLANLRPPCEPFFRATGTTLAVPVVQEESVVAILCLGTRGSDGLYATEDLRFLATLANVAASSMAVALNYHEIERQLSVQTFLSVLSESLVRYAGSEEAIPSAIGVLRTFLGIEDCFILTFEKGEARVHGAREVEPGLRFELAAVGKALLEGKGSPCADPALTGMLDASGAEIPGDSGRARTLLYLPLTSGRDWIGLLALDGRRGRNGAVDPATLTGAFRAILSQGLLAIRHVAELRSLTEYNDKIVMSLSTSGEMLLVLDADGIILRTNSAAADALGYSEGHLVGLSLRTIVDAEGSGTSVDAFLRRAATGVVQSVDMRLRSRFDRRIPVLVSSSFIVDSAEATREIVVIARDISRLRDAERGREESEWRYQSLFESVLDTVIAFDDEGGIVDVNPAGRELLGTDGKTERAWNLCADFGLDPRRLELLGSEISTRGSIREFEMQLRAPRTGPRVALFTGSADERSAAGRRVIHGILRDVTEQRALQRQLVQAQKMESVGTLAGGIAHDFNNILTATLGYALLIRREIDNREAVLSHLEVVESSARRAAELTRRLLSFARAGVSDRKPVRLNEIVGEAVQLLRRTFDRSIEIRMDCAPDLPLVTGDQGQIHQVLLNLCVNARDAMPAGGTLTVRTLVERVPELTEVHLPGETGSRQREGTDTVVLTVHDTGSGISREDLPRIFDPFFTTKGPGQGTGLGLSIVYGIIKQHGGHIDVASDLGQGTVFTLRFPAAGKDNAESGEKPGPGADARGTETILIVDDEPALRDLVRLFLTAEGYKVLEAGDGLEAIEVFRAHRLVIDAVVIDLIMPKLGGRETWERLKELSPRVKALFATGYGGDEQIQELLSTGVLGIVKKPYEMTALEREIRSILDRPEA